MIDDLRASHLATGSDSAGAGRRTAASSLGIIFSRPFRFLAAAAICALAAMLVGDGVAGGDEGRVLDQSLIFLWRKLSWSRFLADPEADPFWVAHHPLWFAVTCVEAGLIHGVEALLDLRIPPYMEGFFVSYTQVVAAFIAVALSYVCLKDRAGDSDLAILTVAAVWFGSSAICLLTGGFMESALAMFVVWRLWVARPGVAMSLTRVAIVAALDLLMTLAKPYALIYCLVTLPVALRRSPSLARSFLLYGCIVGAFVVGALWFKQACSGGIYAQSVLKAAASADGAFLRSWAQRFCGQLVSFPYGVLWCFPAVATLLFCSRQSRTEILVTAGAILLLVAFFSAFAFWHGGNGIAGPRYVLPFLLGFLPAVGEGLARLRERAPATLYAVPCLALFFLPVLDYRHNLVLNIPNRDDLSLRGEPSMAAYYGARGVNAEPLPLYKPAFHPAALAWRVAAAKWSGAESVAFHVARGRDIIVATRHILPQTGVSRLYYVLENHPRRNGRAYDSLSALPRWLLVLPGAAAALLALGFLCKVAMSARSLAKGGPRNSDWRPA